MVNKGFAHITLLLLAVLGIVISLNTVTILHHGHPEAVEPFNNKSTYILSEKVTYLFRQPRISDAVIFKPDTTEYSEFVGVVGDIKDENRVRSYIIYSAYGKPWTVSAEKIKQRVYYPKFTEAHFAKIQLPYPTSAPVSTANFKKYTNPLNGIFLSYPENWYLYDKGSGYTDMDGEQKFLSPYESILISSKSFPDIIPEGAEYPFEGMSISYHPSSLDPQTLADNLKSSGYTIKNTEKIKIDGKEGIKLTLDFTNDKTIPPAFQKLTYYYLISASYKDSKTLIINLTNGGNWQGEYEAIISSLKIP